MLGRSDARESAIRRERQAPRGAGADRCPLRARGRTQAFRAPKISFSIDFASPNNMRLLSL